MPDVFKVVGCNVSITTLIPAIIVKPKSPIRPSVSLNGPSGPVSLCTQVVISFGDTTGSGQKPLFNISWTL